MVSASATFAGPQYYDRHLGPIQFDPFAAALASRRGNPYRGHAQGVLVEAQAG